MPVVDVDTDELRTLAATEKDDEALKADLFGLGLEFEGETDDGDLQFEFAPDRLDRLSVEGVARSLRYQYGTDRGVYVPKTNDPEWTIVVDEDVPPERPYVTGAVVRGLDMTEAKLESLIQVQEKLHATMGRKRAKGAIGVHDLTMLKGRAYDDREARSASDSASGERGEARPEGGPRNERTASETSREQSDPRAAPKTIRYTGVEPDEDTFVPLASDRELTPGEVLTEHPTGEQYADLVAAYERYPAIYDDIGLFSFPPVINGRRTEVSEESRDLFIELTGTDQWTIDRMCTILCYALDARGGRVEEVRVEYPDGGGVEGSASDGSSPYDGDLVRPDLDTTEKTVSHALVERTLGVDLDPETVVDCLERAGLDAERSDGDDAPDNLAYEVSVPPYRVDVLHAYDVVDDVGRAYGFDRLEPRYPEVSTVGGRHERSRLEDAVRSALVGLGFQDTLNFHMTSEREAFETMAIDADDLPDDGATDAVGVAAPPTIRSPYSEDYTIVRPWALPSLVSVLENNTHRAYPQDLSEVGFVAHVDRAEPTKVAEHRSVAAVLARTDASYEDAKARLAALCGAFDADLETPATTHQSFLDGRCAAVEIDGDRVGVVGELHPEVLVAHDLELPVAAFEFRLDALAAD